MIHRVMICQDCGRRVEKKSLGELGGTFLRTSSYVQRLRVWVHEDYRVPYNDEGRHAFIGGIRARFVGFEIATATGEEI